MITVEMMRDNGQIYHFPNRFFHDSLEALYNLVECELSFGGKIVDLSETHLTVKTDVFGTVDTTTFSGPKEEMIPLLEVSRFYLEAMHEHSSLVKEEVLNNLKNLPGKDGKKAFFISALAPIFMGGSCLKIALILGCGLRDEEDVRLASKARRKDIIAAAQLARDGHCSFREALSL